MSTPFAYPSKEQFAEMLKTVQHSELVTKFLFTTETPYAFRDRKKGYEFLVNHITKSLALQSGSVTLIGSGRIGFSLDPFKFGTPFSPASDLDLAIIDEKVFDTAWLEMVGLGARFARLNKNVQQWVNDHRTNNVYWGYLEPGKLQGAVALHRVWFPTFAGLSRYAFLADRYVSGRLYRTWDHARGHQLYSLAKILRTL